MLNAFALSCGNANLNLTLLTISFFLLSFILGLHFGLKLAKVNKAPTKTLLAIGVIVIAFIVAVSYYIDADAQVIFDTPIDVAGDCPEVSIWDSFKEVKYGSAYFAVVTPLTAAVTYAFVWILRLGGKLKTYKS